MNQMESYGSMEGSIVHMDRVGNDDDSYYSDRNWFYFKYIRFKATLTDRIEMTIYGS